MNIVIEDGAKVAEGTFIGHNVVIRRGSSVGKGCVIGHNTVIEEDVRIGNNVRIQACCYITKGTIIEDDVFIGPSVSTYNDRYICSHGRPKKSFLRAPLIKYGARIGGGTNIGPEVTIGENSFIGCGSLVLKNVPRQEIWFGSPAKQISHVPEDELL